MSVPTEVGDALLAESGRLHQARNGVPDDRTRADRRRCLEIVSDLLGDHLEQEGIRTSALGVEWTEVFDLHPRRTLEAARLAGFGWLPLDGLLGAGSRGTQSRRWAVVEDGRVLAGIQLVDRPDDPVGAVLRRCRERSEVRLCDVLELRELRRREHPFPVDAAELRTAAQIESGLGGRLLAPWASGSSATAPAELPGRRRRLVLAVSGVDGSGKSTLRAALAESLERAGVPVSTVWVRPGMGLGRLTALAAWAKRLLRQDARPGLRAMADPDAARPASRRGAVGWVWALLVTVSFLSGVWRQHLRSRGVVIYDRHLIDALATLDFAYDGVDLRIQEALVRALLPRADVRVHLDVPAEVSVARKPDDLLGEHAVRRQLAGYARWLDRIPPTVVLDATADTGDLVTQVLRTATTRIHRRHRSLGIR